MTRDEEINIAAEAFAIPYKNGHIAEVGFYYGAKWADEHPKQKEEHQRGLCGNMIN